MVAKEYIFIGCLIQTFLKTLNSSVKVVYCCTASVLVNENIVQKTQKIIWGEIGGQHVQKPLLS